MRMHDKRARGFKPGGVAIGDVEGKMVRGVA
jgi:hypothetical protein